ncbi:MAG: class I SAM-dependent methyltransferase [Candidatus Promineifilaceae bacterium]|nr:class I SAM-dependent methyltransferase [Candidatus Promineifilaceae bacterium]
MAYYDRLARRWHEITGYQGGSFKRHVLNDVLIEEMGPLAGRAILELGAGNGYFMPLALAGRANRAPARLVISDASATLLAIAERRFHLPGATYLQLDVRAPFPFEDASFDLILATMVFNEVSTGGLRRALLECRRVLRQEGLLLLTITHPQFVASLDRRRQLREDKDGILTMPAAGQLRLPIVPRRWHNYERLLTRAGFSWETRAIHANDKVLAEKPGLRPVKNRPIALLASCGPSASAV